jgi:hypothetical protein
VRTICTGIACSLSVISVTSADEGEDACHLANDAGIVDHRQPGGNLVLLPLVDDDPRVKGVACRVQDLRDLAAGLLPFLDAKQLAQAFVFDFQLLRAQQGRRLLERACCSAQFSSLQVGRLTK